MAKRIKLTRKEKIARGLPKVSKYQSKGARETKADKGHK